MNNGKRAIGGGHHDVSFCDVISVENLFEAWREFCRGKHKKADVAEFELRLEDNIFGLHRELVSGTWQPKPYTAFYIQDPKLRRIHKATVRDRVLYQAVYRALYPIFDSGFIHDSYSSQNFKGTHRAIERFEKFTRRETKNYTERAFALQCDIRRFFESVDHAILFDLIAQKISDGKLLALISKIIASYEATEHKGLPLGNVTSQLFANIYLNEFDQYAKQTLRCSSYVRYCDDFAILDKSEVKLLELIPRIEKILRETLLLSLHPRKVSIRKIHQGIDLLGYVSLPHYKVLRTRTKKRMMRKVREAARAFAQGKVEKERFESVIASYKGMLGHARGKRIEKQIDFLVGGVGI